MEELRIDTLSRRRRLERRSAQTGRPRCPGITALAVQTVRLQPTMQNHVRTRAPKQRYTNDAHLCMCALEHRHDQVLNVRRAQMYTYLHRYLPGGELFDVIYDTVASADPKDYRCLYCCF